ncbi:hypothetical protein VCSRO68_2529 [Vibrio cholerae]|nr:hypothetical protein VCSRO68_2529 [Vibrio cholerae]
MSGIFPSDLFVQIGQFGVPGFAHVKAKIPPEIYQSGDNE